MILLLASIAHAECQSARGAELDRCFTAALAAGDVALAIELGTFAESAKVRRATLDLRERFGPVDVCITPGPGHVAVQRIAPLTGRREPLETLAVAHATTELAIDTCFSGALAVGTYEAAPTLEVRPYPRPSGEVSACAAITASLAQRSAAEVVATLPASTRRDPAVGACFAWSGAPEAVLDAFPTSALRPGRQARKLAARGGLSAIAAVWELVEVGAVDEDDAAVVNALAGAMDRAGYPASAAAVRHQEWVARPQALVDLADVGVAGAWQSLARGDVAAARKEIAAASRASPTWLPAGEILQATLEFREGLYDRVEARLAAFEGAARPVLPRLVASAPGEGEAPVRAPAGIDAVRAWRLRGGPLGGPDTPALGPDSFPDLVRWLGTRVSPTDLPADLARRLHTSGDASLTQIERERAAALAYKAKRTACEATGSDTCVGYAGEALLAVDLDKLAFVAAQRRVGELEAVLRHERRRLEWALVQSARLRFAANVARTSPDLVPDRVRAYDAERIAEARARPQAARLATIAALEPIAARLTGDLGAEARFRLGELQAEEGRANADGRAWLERSLATEREILAKSPQFHRLDEVSFSVANTLLELGRDDEAAQELTRLVTSYTESKLRGAAYSRLGEHHARRGDFAQAKVAYTAAAAAGDPGRADALVRAALCELKLGDPVAALSGMEAALGLGDVPAEVQARGLLWIAVLSVGTGHEAEGRAWFAKQSADFDAALERGRVELVAHP